MRIWDIPPSRLCRQHLLGEHVELHALWSILVNDIQGYRQHPETKRWEGKLPALFSRHDALVVEMLRRGYTHNSPLPSEQAIGSAVQDAFVHALSEQARQLVAKGCDCQVSDLMEG